MTYFLSVGRIGSWTDDEGPWPVVWSPDGGRLGSARTRRGALDLAAKVSISPLERRSASLCERLDGSLVWYCGPVLDQRRRRRRPKARR